METFITALIAQMEKDAGNGIEVYRMELTEFDVAAERWASLKSADRNYMGNDMWKCESCGPICGCI
jgi:hypothetical protein